MVARQLNCSAVEVASLDPRWIEWTLTALDAEAEAAKLGEWKAGA